jgi:heme-degrading monooxygenase HmoA
MAYTLSILKVEDYTRWKADWDSSADMRKAGGQGTFHILRTEDDLNNLVVLIEWDNLGTAHKFMESTELREAFKRSGVIGQGEHYFLEEVERSSV